MRANRDGQFPTGIVAVACRVIRVMEQCREFDMRLWLEAGTSMRQSPRYNLNPHTIHSRVTR